MKFWKCYFCEKCDFENVNFANNAILKQCISWIIWFLICEFLDKMWILPQCEMLSKYCEFWVKTPHDSCWKNSSSCIKERKRIFNEMLNFEWHMLKSLCEISFLEFQIVVNISLEKVKEECAFNYPRLSFNLIYYRTLRSLSSSVFLSFFFAVNSEFRFECCVFTARNQMRFFAVLP